MHALPNESEHHDVSVARLDAQSETFVVYKRQSLKQIHGVLNYQLSGGGESVLRRPVLVPVQLA